MAGNLLFRISGILLAPLVEMTKGNEHPVSWRKTGIRLENITIISEVSCPAGLTNLNEMEYHKPDRRIPCEN
jgi:hypothetical protein